MSCVEFGSLFVYDRSNSSQHGGGAVCFGWALHFEVASCFGYLGIRLSLNVLRTVMVEGHPLPPASVLDGFACGERRIVTIPVLAVRKWVCSGGILTLWYGVTSASGLECGLVHRVTNPMKRGRRPQVPQVSQPTSGH